MSYYAVAVGRAPGIYETWDLCKEQVHGFKGAQFKKFNSRAEALTFCKLNGKKEAADQMQAIHSSAQIEASNWQDLPSLENAIPRFDQPGNWHINNNLAAAFTPFSQARYIITKGNWVMENSRPAIYYANTVIVYCHANFEYRKRVNSDFPDARGGIGIYWPGMHDDNVSARLEGKATLSRAVIQSAINAVEIANARGYRQMVIRTENEFLLKAMTDWIYKWSNNGWQKTSSHSPVKDRDDFMDLLALIRDIRVDWEKSTSDSIGNKMAKQLASKGLEKRIKI